MFGHETDLAVRTERRCRIVQAAGRESVATFPERAYDVLDRVYKLRKCFVCAAPFWCIHREPAVDLAECEALTRAMDRRAVA